MLRELCTLPSCFSLPYVPAPQRECISLFFLLIQQETAVACYLSFATLVMDGGRGVVSLLFWFPLSLSPALCPESQFGAFSVILALLPMAAKLCIFSLVGLAWNRVACPPPAVGDLSWYWCKILGPGCLLPLL